MILEKHGVKNICFSSNGIFDDTKIGIWLNNNNIDYRISLFEDVIATDNQGNLHCAIVVESIEFFSDEDFTAFKLRWSA